MRQLFIGLSIVFTALLVHATDSKSYDVKMDGMVCANCVAMIKSALSKIPEIDSKSLQVTLKKQEATFKVAQANVDDKALNEKIKTAIEGAGYTVTMINGQKIAKAK